MYAMGWYGISSDQRAFFQQLYLGISWKIPAAIKCTLYISSATTGNKNQSGMSCDPMGITMYATRSPWDQDAAHAIPWDQTMSHAVPSDSNIFTRFLRSVSHAVPCMWPNCIPWIITWDQTVSHMNPEYCTAGRYVGTSNSWS